MKVAFNLILLFFFLSLMSCGTKKQASIIKKNEVRTIYEKALQHIVNDTSFRKSLKRAYPDLKACKEIDFIPLTYTKPISVNFFQKEELIKTSYFSKYSELNYLEFEKLKNHFDSLDKTGSDPIRFYESRGVVNCPITLTFSKVTKKILLVEYKIIGKNVDSRIIHTPRKGYYLVEFNSEEEIITHIYKILIW